MDEDWLRKQISAGRSIESIAREVGKDPSTVGYWVRKHGLSSVHAQRHTSRGALDRARLEELVGRGLTTPDRRRGRAQPGDRASLAEALRARDRAFARRGDRCGARRGGATARVPPSRGDGAPPPAPSGFRCLRCRSEAVAARRRRVKAILVAEAGGACVLCGYDRCAAALEFHHRDPGSKRFSISFGGVSIAVDRLREEARKCVLVCANCHAELEIGAAILPVSASPA